MSILNEPAVQMINYEDIILKRLKNFPEHEEDFIRSITGAIEKDYDEISIAFAKSLLKIDKKGFDEFGFFTLGKDIWIIFDKSSECLLGYEVITRKRGGCIKLGPTYIKPYARGKRYAVKAIDGLSNVYKNMGARKIYVTAPLSHNATAVLDFQYLALNLEAILYNHYSTKSSERISGRFIGQHEDRINISPRVKYGSNKLHSVLVNCLGDNSIEDFTEFVVQNMHRDYDDIDNNFVNSILKGVDRGIDSAYEKKGKLLVSAFSEASLEGVAIITLKRGGVMKVIPFLLKDDYVSYENVKRILSVIENCAEKYNRRKITFFISARDVNITNILSSNQYMCEGVIREPYKKGIDMVILSKFLT